MTVWTLAKFGRHGALVLGASKTEIVAAYGEPDDFAHSYMKGGRIHLHILNYDDIELHFANEKLQLIHCEFGPPTLWLPQKVESPRLGLEAGGLEWPITLDEIQQLAEANGLSTERVESSLDTQLRFGLCTAIIHTQEADQDDQASWGIMRREQQREQAAS